MAAVAWSQLSLVGPTRTRRNGLPQRSKGEEDWEDLKNNKTRPVQRHAPIISDVVDNAWRTKHGRGEGGSCKGGPLTTSINAAFRLGSQKHAWSIANRRQKKRRNQAKKKKKKKAHG